VHGWGRTFLGLPHVNGTVGEGDLDTPLIKGLLHATVKLTLDPPLFERLGLEAGPNDYGRVLEPVQAKDLKRLENAGTRNLLPDPQSRLQPEWVWY